MRVSQIQNKTFGPLGSLLVPFGFLLAHFWCPWDHFCSPLRSMFTLLRSPGVIFNSFWNFRWVSYVNSYFFEKSSLKFSLFVFMFLKYFRQQAKHPKTIPGTLAFALHHLSGPERKLAAGNLCFKGLLFNHGVGGIAQRKQLWKHFLVNDVTFYHKFNEIQ